MDNERYNWTSRGPLASGPQDIHLLEVLIVCTKFSVAPNKLPTQR